MKLYWQDCCTVTMYFDSFQAVICHCLQKQTYKQQLQKQATKPKKMWLTRFLWCFLQERGEFNLIRTFVLDLGCNRCGYQCSMRRPNREHQVVPLCASSAYLLPVTWDPSQELTLSILLRACTATCMAGTCQHRAQCGHGLSHGGDTSPVQSRAWPRLTKAQPVP